jgi:phosphoglycerate dehydrogenase-like enzyme
VNVRVVYTEPFWTIDQSGLPNPDLADVERSVFSPDISMDCGLFKDGFKVSGQDLIDYVGGTNALVIYRCQVTQELVNALAPTCRVVVRCGVGVDNLGPGLLKEAGIASFNVPDYCGDEVSCHTLALLLALERRVCIQDRLIRADKWDILAGGIPRRLAKCTAGIVGFGRIGKATARKLQAFYAHVVAYDPWVSTDLMASHGVIAARDLSELFSMSDAVVLHAALTEETHHLISSQVLSQARPGTFLVNTARGRLVDTAAVVQALKDGRLGGFASDVFSPEDPNNDPIARELLDRDDVVVSAHRAFLSTESQSSLRHRVAQTVASVLRDGPLPTEGRVT